MQKPRVQQNYSGSLKRRPNDEYGNSLKYPMRMFLKEQEKKK